MHTTRKPLHPALLSHEHRADVHERLALTLHGYPGSYLAEAGGDPDFALWLGLLDVRMRRRLGTSHHGVTDRPWREGYDEEVDPFVFADNVINDLLFRGVR